jgi:hypothetical protein
MDICSGLIAASGHFPGDERPGTMVEQGFNVSGSATGLTLRISPSQF